MRIAALFLFSVGALAEERAAFDSAGRLLSLICDGEGIELRAQLIAVLPSGRRIPIQQHMERSLIRLEAATRTWTGPMELPDGGRGQFSVRAAENEAGVKYEFLIKAESSLELASVEFVLDVPRERFVGGKLSPAGRTLPAVKTPQQAFYEGQPPQLRFDDSAGNWSLSVEYDSARPTQVVDRWDRFGRSYQLRAALQQGPMTPGQSAALSVTLQLRGKATAAPAQLRVDMARARYKFDGFGANYCFGNDSPIAEYTLQNLKIAWARFEMKAQEWERQRENPGPRLRKDWEMMRRVQEMGTPYALSLWWLPERLYTDPNEKPRSAHNRRIAPEQWDGFLELLGSYLLYAKSNYGVEPDLFSFNEANIGVYVVFTPEEHRDALKRIGAHLQKLGLKTKMLLGDATGARGTHEYVLAAAADPEAMKYVGAVAFHTWGGATPEQYQAWGDVAEWLGLPLLAAEVGVDAFAHRNRMYDSYHYGLREAQMQQELILYARPQGTQFWEFTGDYGLARAQPDGTVEPTARFWLMKHFTDLTPQKSDVVATGSDQKDVLVTAFRKNEENVVHVVNLGGARSAKLEGLAAGTYRLVTTTESTHYKDSSARALAGLALKLDLPARSIVTLLRER